MSNNDIRCPACNSKQIDRFGYCRRCGYNMIDNSFILNGYEDDVDVDVDVDEDYEMQFGDLNGFS